MSDQSVALGTDALERRSDPARVVAAPAAVAPASAAVVPPPMGLPKQLLYIACSLIVGLTQGLGTNIISANLPAVQAHYGVTQNEATWITAAYLTTSATASLLMFKFRMQFGLRLFAELGIALFVVANLANLFADTLESTLIARAALGFAAAPLSSLAFLYVLEAMPPAKKMSVGICLGLLGAQLAAPVARIISPQLLEIGQWDGLYDLEMGLACVSFAIAFLLPITSPPRLKSFEPLDFLTYPLIAFGLGAIAVVLSLAKGYWWFEAPWLGTLLACAVAALVIVVMIEINRTRPMIDISWLTNYDMIVFAGALTVFRILLAEPTTGVAGFLQILGINNDQTITLYAIILAATAAGYLCVSLVIKPGREYFIHCVALTLIAWGAWRDAHSTSLTRPEEFYLSQAVIAFAGGLFLPPALVSGFGKALARGPQYVTSFLVVFLVTQNVGGLIGSAALGTFATIREKFHSSQIVEHLVLTDPSVVLRSQQLAGAYNSVLSDSTLRSAEGFALLGQQATREANVLAYNDLFLLVAGLAVAALLVLLLDKAWMRFYTARYSPLSTAT